MAATSTPDFTVAATVAAASLIVGNGTTATEVSAGITASFTQISVTRPSVPSEPMKSLVKSYPAEDFLPLDTTKDPPWALASFDNSTVCKNDSKINDPIFHRPVSSSIGPTASCPNHSTDFCSWTGIRRKP